MKTPATRFLFLFLLLTGSLRISAQNNLNCTLRSVKYYPFETLANIWGYVDSLGNEYALAGGRYGLSIVNVTNPDSIYEVKRIPGPSNLWKEIRTWGHYAYVTTEGGGGLQIVNLANLPGINLPYHTWQPVVNGTQLSSIHALHIDNGKIYLYGSNTANGGIVVGDLSDPWNPTLVNTYSGAYVHDGIVRNDTAYAGEIYNGRVKILNMAQNPPATINTQNTPNSFTHNTWLSDDSKYMFTTDEVSNSFLAAYDISDILDIRLADKIQSNPGSSSIVHNTYYKNGYCLTSWYKDGFTIVDAHRPTNLVQVGNYDTYNGVGTGFHGAWGVYGYLPSGNILVSNIDTSEAPLSTNAGALFVVTPTYQRASYLEGTVLDSLTLQPILGASVAFAGTGTQTLSDAAGAYATGTPAQGQQTITVSKTGYLTRSYTVTMTPGLVDSVTILLPPVISGVKNPENSTACVYINEHCHVSLPVSGFWQLQVFDLSGRQVVPEQTVKAGQHLTLSGLAAGIYPLRFTSHNGQVIAYKLAVH